MTVTSLTLTNPGAETGDVTGWTSRSGGASSALASGTNGVTSHGGSFHFVATASGATAKWDQEVILDVSHHAGIDAGGYGVKASGWHRGLGSDGDTGAIYVEAIANDGSTILDRYELDQSDPTGWTQEHVILYLPALTRRVRIGTNNVRNDGTQLSSYWDDFTLDLSDDALADFPIQVRAYVLGVQVFGNPTVDARTNQLGAYGLVSHPAEELRLSQMPIMALVASETSNGLYQVKAHQLGVYALVRGMTDRRDLRAWTFTQDDHDFYVLQLGEDGTLVFDKLTNQWAQWRSPAKTFWRGNDGVQWEGWNICCDTDTGILWRIDPEGRLDDATTPITSVITGGTNERMRKNAQCFMAELTVSEGQPPTGFDDGSVGITLRTSDDGGQTFTDHGEVAGESIGEDVTIRWYGLGVIPSPGRVFELTDSGYARRIDSLTMEVGGDTGG